MNTHGAILDRGPYLLLNALQYCNIKIVRPITAKRRTQTWVIKIISFCFLLRFSNWINFLCQLSHLISV